MVTIGFHKQCITPDLPVALSGYAGERIAKGVHDDLYTRCISMEYNDKRYIIAQCDCLAVDEALRQAVLAELADLRIPDAHFVLTATHTHSGPAGTIDTSAPPFTTLTDVFGLSSPEYQKYLAKQIACAVRTAFSDLLECTLTIGRGTIEQVGTDRHDPKLPGDPSLLVLHFQRTDGKQVLLYNYACHPTVLNPENLLITADFPYAVEQHLNYDMVMFLNSCAGDISTRFTRTSSTFAQAEAYAPLITSAIQKALETPVYQGNFDKLQIRQFEITLPVKKMPPAEAEEQHLKECEAALSKAREQNLDAAGLRILASYVEGAKVSVGLCMALQGLDNIETHFSVITLQDLKIAVVPGELFSTLGRLLKNDGIEVFGYGNGYFMYFADEEAYEKMYYEAMSSPFEKGVGELLVSEIKRNA